MTAGDICFLGKSGTGKSTHTVVVEPHPGSDLMNDDNPVVRVVEGRSMSTVLPGRENTLLPPGVCAGGSFCTVAAMSGKHDSERERIGKFCLALAVRIDHEMGSPYSFSALRHHLDIIRLSPIYLLGCRPDEEAARQSFHTLTGR